MLDYVWFWQSEGLGGGGDAVPDETSGLGRLVREYGGQFAYLGQPQRIAEAVRVSHYANTAYRILKRQAPHVGVIVSGWGGDRWMRFGDFYEGLDKTLPAGRRVRRAGQHRPGGRTERRGRVRQAVAAAAALADPLVGERRRRPAARSVGAAMQHKALRRALRATCWRSTAQACSPSTGGRATSRKWRASKPALPGTRR